MSGFTGTAGSQEPKTDIHHAGDEESSATHFRGIREPQEPAIGEVNFALAL